MSTNPFNVPILFLIFNRPDTTKIVFNRIKELKPACLFISADGPRPDKINEKENCTLARSIINDIDWPCEIKTNFSDSNLGCKKGVSSGINWFFSNVEEGIILEDDCLPDISFFNFCRVLLEKYRHDTRIMHIGGVNLQDGKVRGKASYYFSKINHVWGWATWKRAWDKFDVNISSFKYLLDEDYLGNLFPDKTVKKYWQKRYNSVYSNKVDTWDHQWHYTTMINNGLSIIPNINLVSNIGFGKEATHTIQGFHPLSNINVKSINNIIHPSFIIPNYTADTYSFKKYFNPNKLIKLKLWLYLFLKK
jgi:hypothetical protein